MAKKCEEWLKDNHPDLYERLYSEGKGCLQKSALIWDNTDR